MLTANLLIGAAARRSRLPRERFGRVYLPKDWAEDGARRDKAGVPEEIEFTARALEFC
jgi:hypothetical protein